MINFKTFLLNENLNTRVINNEDTFIKRVKNDCSEYLSNSGPFNQLYRGDRDNSKRAMFKSSIRLDRKPLTTSLEAHNELDNYFNNKFGFKYRSGSLFCHNKVSKVHGYARQGQVYNIFPINGYKLCGSKEVEDLWEFIGSSSDVPLKLLTYYKDNSGLSKKELLTYEKIIKNDSIEKLTKSELDIIEKLNIKILDNLHYFESKNPKDFEQGEIMVHGPGYYAIVSTTSQSKPNTSNVTIDKLYA